MKKQKDCNKTHAKALLIIMISALCLSVFSSAMLPLLKNSSISDNPGFTYETDSQSGTAKLGDGDYIVFGKYKDREILWRVLDTDQDKGALILSEYVLCFKAFDASGYDGKAHKETDASLYGSSSFETSTLKKWLNSKEEKVDYGEYAPTKENVYNGYNAYDNEKGFLCSDNFTDEQLALIGDDGVFLPSTANIKKYLGKSAAKRCADSALQGDDSAYISPKSKAVWYWTGDGIPTNNVSVTTVTSSGTFYKTLAYDSMTGVCPALYLKKAEVTVQSGDGSKDSPYILG